MVEEQVFDAKFQWHDYILFCLMLVLSIVIGIYFGFKGKKVGTVDDYLFGGKSLTAIPIAISTASAIISALSFMTMPAEIYKFGAGISSVIFTLPLMATLSYIAVFPIYFKMKVNTIFEYIEIRFNSRLKKIVASCFTIKAIFVCPIYTYLPSILLGQGSNFNVNHIIVATTIICIFYTTLGGIKAVVWTDALQYIFMFATFLTVCIIGTNRAESISEIFRTAIEGNRLDLGFDLDLIKRETIWAAVFGYSIIWFEVLVGHQTIIQKFLSLPNLRELKKSLMLFSICMSGTFFLIAYLGLIMYKEFQNCDPLLSNRINKLDQMVPYYILNVTRNTPGLAGLFIAGMFSASLSSLSSSLNAIACTIYNDFIKDFLPKDTSQKKKRLLLNLLVIVTGCISIGLSFVIPYLGSLFGAFFSLAPIAIGPMLGLFLLGMFVPKAHTKGAAFGMISSIIFMICMVVGTLYYKINKQLVPESRALSTESCPAYLNASSFRIPEVNAEEQPMYLYRISFLYYTPIGAAIVVTLGIIVSSILKSEDKEVKKDLISPLMYWALSPSEDYLPIKISETKLSSINELV